MLVAQIESYQKSDPLAMAVALEWLEWEWHSVVA